MLLPVLLSTCGQGFTWDPAQGSMWLVKGPEWSGHGWWWWLGGGTVLKNAYQWFLFGGVEKCCTACPRTWLVAGDDLEHPMLLPPPRKSWNCRSASHYMQFNKYNTRLCKSLNHSSIDYQFMKWSVSSKHWVQHVDCNSSYLDTFINYTLGFFTFSCVCAW